MPKMEVEFTDAQLEKVEILKTKDVSVGQAIDLLFELQNEIIYQLEDIEDEDKGNLYEKIKYTSFDAEVKAELLKSNYKEQTYDEQVQRVKHGLKWSKFL